MKMTNQDKCLTLLMRENCASPSSARPIAFAVSWANRLELELEKVHAEDTDTVRFIIYRKADELSYEAKFHDRQTDSTFAYAVDFLDDCWVHGHILKDMYRKRLAV